MNENTAAAIAAICAAVVSVATIVGQVILSRRMGEVKTAVNGQTDKVIALVERAAHAEGVANHLGKS